MACPDGGGDDLSPTEQTRNAAYFAIKASGVLSAMRFKVFTLIWQHGPINMRGIARIARGGYWKASIDSDFRPRVTELHQMDAIEIFDQKHDDESGHLANRWVISGRLPKPLPKKETIKQKILRLELTIEDLRGQLRDCQNKKTLFEM